jgi:hypothetical protein
MAYGGQRLLDRQFGQSTQRRKAWPTQRVLDQVASRHRVDLCDDHCLQLCILHFADVQIDKRLGAAHQGGFAADFDRERVSCSGRRILGGVGGG